MKKIFILLSSMFLLVSCLDSVALLGPVTGATNGKVVQSSLRSGVSYGIKKQTGKSPIGHAVEYVKEKNNSKNQESCSFNYERELEICLTAKERAAANQNNLKNMNSFEKPTKEIILSLQSSINKKSKIKYLD
jgi:hypothetical protein